MSFVDQILVLVSQPVGFSVEPLRLGRPEWRRLEVALNFSPIG
jgi:hypothetical protein